MTTSAGSTPLGPEHQAYGALRELPLEKCLLLLASAAIGRVGFVSARGVEIVPVNYRLGEGPTLFVSTRHDGIVAQLAAAGTDVAFEVDHEGVLERSGWSVLMQGTLAELDQQGRAAYQKLRLQPDSWAGPARPVTVQFTPRVVTGRSISATGWTPTGPQ